MKASYSVVRVSHRRPVQVAGPFPSVKAAQSWIDRQSEKTDDLEIREVLGRAGSG